VDGVLANLGCRALLHYEGGSDRPAGQGGRSLGGSRSAASDLADASARLRMHVRQRRLPSALTWMLAGLVLSWPRGQTVRRPGRRPPVFTSERLLFSAGVTGSR